MQVLCSEYFRLHQHYEAALRRWEQAELSSNQVALSDPSKRLSLEIEKKAQDERDAAKDRTVRHRQYCATCNHKSKDRATD
jgi:hypothetical protein